MKFSRHLEAQIPELEWKNAYIDYHGLKKRLTAIRKAQESSESQATLPDASKQLRPREQNVFCVDLIAAQGAQDQPPLQILASNETCLDQSHASVTKHSSVLDWKNVDSVGDERTESNQRKDHRRSSTLSGKIAREFGSPSTQMSPVMPLKDLMPTLDLLQKRFFEKLDSELDKIESFYLDREKEAKARFIDLKQQLDDLKNRKRSPRARQKDGARLDDKYQWIPYSSRTSNTNAGQTIPSKIRLSKLSFKTNSSTTIFTSPSPNLRDSERRRMDPEEYRHAKENFKKAVLEFNRTLEVLNNYRNLNVIGFRKALKKFEKITSISAQEAYIREKVEPSAFASTNTVTDMLKDTERFLTSKFADGDQEFPEAESNRKTHHFALCRTGIALGLGIPALVSGLYYSFDELARQEIPAWDGLLYVYGIILVPVLFSLLVGVNIAGWARVRVNYVSIFELDAKTKLDYQEYFEIPAILFSTLCYAFWLSFARVTTRAVNPTTWPLIWLAFCAFLITNPLPIYHRSSRSWLFRILGRLLLSGMRRVRFADFWMGDQFCSLVFPLSNLYFVGCIYTQGFNESWRQCTSSSPRHWAIPLLLASLPSLVRLIQSIKRWHDMRLTAHLINGGKYASGIVAYGFFYHWRHHGGESSGPSFIWYCLFATLHSTYSCLWDLLMDWSLLRINAKYPLLREDILCPNHVPLYYLAIVTNILTKFSWVLYIPVGGPDFLLRTFIVAMLEIMRRWQWNFYRLENEHVLGVDQYGMTEVVTSVQVSYSFYDAA